jgi:hypothetical protein
VAALLVGGWALFCAVQLALAYRDARVGIREAASARRTIASEGLDASHAEVRLDHARRAFHLAHRRSSSPALAPLWAVPVLGRQLRSFAQLADSASQMAGVVGTGAEAVGAVLDDGLPTGPERAASLRALADRAAIAETALGRVRLPPRDGLMEPLRRHRDALRRDVASTRATLRTAAEGLTGVATILEGPRRYLLLAANNAEMRAGSGMFLSIGTVATAEGSLEVGPLRPSGDLVLPPPGVSVEGDLEARWGWLQPGREWRNLATTPRFEVTAPVAVRMWESLTGERLDGAVALDVPALAAIVGATGPLPVGDGTVDESTVADRLLRDQYQGLDVDDPQAGRREELGQMAAAVVRALENGDYSPGRLAAGLARTARGRHLLAWSAHPGDQRTWETLRVTGSLEPDSLAVNLLNRGGNKLDPFLDVEAALELHRAGDATEAAVRLRVANRIPPGQPPYVTGPHPDSGVGEGDYLGIVAVNLPGAATDVAVDGAGPQLTSGTDGPTGLVTTRLLLPPGQETTVVVRFRLPPSERSVEVVPSARVPPTRWEAGGHRWLDDEPTRVSWQWD